MSALVLRDVHLPAAPPWWPPAPGWWALAALVLAALAVLFWRRRLRARREAAAAAVFDRAIAQASTPAARVASASELLRRAARRVRGDADRLAGEDWLRFLDTPSARFVEGPGRAVLDAPFRADLDTAIAHQVVALARRRFLQLMLR